MQLTKLTGKENHHFIQVKICADTVLRMRSSSVLNPLQKWTVLAARPNIPHLSHYMYRFSYSAPHYDAHTL